MYDYLKARETHFMLTEKMLKNQPEINSKIRSSVVDWLVSTHQKLKLVPDALYMWINIMDRYLYETKI